jgi:hypothetical protein
MKQRPARKCKQQQKVVVDHTTSDENSDQEYAPVSKGRVKRGPKDARPSSLKVLAAASRVQAPAAVQKRARRVRPAAAAEEPDVDEAIAETLLKLSGDDDDT